MIRFNDVAAAPMDVFFFWMQCAATGFIGGVLLFALIR